MEKKPDLEYAVSDLPFIIRYFVRNIKTLLPELVSENVNYHVYKCSKIQNGDEVIIEQIPYIVSVQEYADYSFQHICGGSIIHESFILTAAHCFNNRENIPNNFKVRVGSVFTKNGGQEENVYKIIKHPNFSIHTSDNDIALLFLTNPLQIDDQTTKIIPMPSQDIRVKNGSEAIIAGWGDNITGGNPVSKLLMGKIHIENHETCYKYYLAENFTITDNMMCANSTENIDACVGDSGGPMLI
ncbi:mite allergen Eur m 3-like [Arctopsyche grandis]|uniref:mite allergen Eur m 3-like n=1 Tax=Arctopsyche grandis TaxID=121162 RepID=UPI00406D9539